MQLGTRNSAPFARSENDEIRVRRKCHRRKPPLLQATRVVRERPIQQGHRIGPLVVKFYPIRKIAVAIRQAPIVNGQEFIDDHSLSNRRGHPMAQ